MWKTVKAMKKILLLQLDNIKHNIINLSGLTLGLKWDTVNFMIGNCRLSTSNNQNKITLKGDSSKDSITIDAYNTLYKHNRISIPTNIGQEVTISTNTNYFYLTTFCEWNGSGYISDVGLSIYIDIYGIDSNGNKIFLKTETLNEDMWSWSGGWSESCTEDMCWADASGEKSIIVLIQIDSQNKYDKLVVKITDIFHDYSISYYHYPTLIFYVDTTQELERTSTDVHLIAWEES